METDNFNGYQTNNNDYNLASFHYNTQHYVGYLAVSSLSTYWYVTEELFFKKIITINAMTCRCNILVVQHII